MLTILEKLAQKDKEIALAKKAKLEKSNDEKNFDLAKKNFDEASKSIVIQDNNVNDIKKENIVSGTNDIITFDNPISKNLQLSYLVWAPCSYYDNNYFFARVVVNSSEIACNIPSKLGPVPNDKAVVEFFCLPKNFLSYTVVSLNKLKIFNASFPKPNKLKKRLFDDSENLTSTAIAEKQVWTIEYCENVLLVILKKYFPFSIAQSIYTKMKSKADEFLEAAILREAESKFQEEIRKKWRDEEDLKEKLIQTSSILTQKDFSKKKEFNIHFMRSKKNLLYLEINDWICYHDVMFPDSRSYAQIIGFSNDNRMPLLLSTNEPLRLDRQIGKVKPIIDKEIYDKTDKSNLVACGSLEDFELKRI